MEGYGFYQFYYRCAVCGKIFPLISTVVFKNNDLNQIVRCIKLSGYVGTNNPEAISEDRVYLLDPELNDHLFYNAFTPEILHTHGSLCDDNDHDGDPYDGMKAYATFVGLKKQVSVPTILTDKIREILEMRKAKENQCGG